MSQITLSATIENIQAVMRFVGQLLEAASCSEKSRVQIGVAIDEIFGNIARYAYAPREGSATVAVEFDGDTVSITFSDRGRPYNPLNKTEPDTTLKADERPIGGLGVFMVSRIMDEVTYVHRDGMNILTIRKKL